ncbi:hypothetical protein COY28_05120 [Candidatus Woesearchaeota archaeon CG_4_10_14_0_2_um_filter_57_5]|nr:MAG: hypothetical protein AUJ68_03330 [Candidatus Woesearchaeota archaeon CG1_02_57_44]PIZ51202.1 MAG: hypothetical protein COY28_05120 [Candidatus Woesearchaeota archaeon CG_4_10_14_0_2_um_filter_57_5]
MARTTADGADEASEVASGDAKALPAEAVNGIPVSKPGAENILVIVAHPDDEVFGPGGTMARYAAEGKNIFAMIFSYGEGSHPWIQPELLAKTRVRESRAAADMLQAKQTVFLGFKEGRFADEVKNKRFKTRFKELIKSIKPSKIFTHSRRDLHADHRAVNRITLDTLRTMRSNCEVYTFEIWNFLFVQPGNHTRLIVDVTDQFSTKIAALRKFHSQYMSLGILLPIVYLRALFAGYEYGYRYAEAFTRVQ